MSGSAAGPAMTEDPAVQRALHVHPDHLDAEGWEAAQKAAFAHGADLPVINVAYAREEEQFEEEPYPPDFSALLDAASARGCVFLIVSRNGVLLPGLPVYRNDDH